MAVTKPGVVEGTPTIPQVVPSSGITDAAPKDEPPPAAPAPTTTTTRRRPPARPEERREDEDRRVRRQAPTTDRERAALIREAGTVDVTNLTDTERAGIIEAFVAGEIDGEVLRRTGRAGSTQITLSPASQLQENKFQGLLDRFEQRQQAVQESQRALRPRTESPGARSARSGKNSLVVRTFSAIVDGFSGKTEKRRSEAIAAEAELRPAVAAGLKKRLPRGEYIDFLKESRWYDILKKEVPEKEFAETWERNENFPYRAARDDGAIEILSAAIPVGTILRGTFRVVRISARAGTTSAGRSAFRLGFKKFIRDETGSVGGFKPRRVADGSITEAQARKAREGLMRAIRRAEKKGKPTNNLIRALNRFRDGSIPIRKTPGEVPGRAGRPQRATEPAPAARPARVRVAERPPVQKSQAVRDAERVLRDAGQPPLSPAAPRQAPRQAGVRRPLREAAPERPAPARPEPTTVRKRTRPVKPAADRPRTQRLSARRARERQRIISERRTKRRRRLEQEKREARIQAQAAKPEPKIVPRIKVQTRTQPAPRPESALATRLALKTRPATRPATAIAPATGTAPATATDVGIPKATALQGTPTPARPPRSRRPVRIIRPDGERVGFKDFSFRLSKGRFARRIVFRLGAFWVDQTLDGSDPIFTQERPKGARKGRTPQQTHAVLSESTRRPTQKSFDQGNARITVGARGVSFKGIPS